jgi:hypothetical protein
VAALPQFVTALRPLCTFIFTGYSRAIDRTDRPLVFLCAPNAMKNTTHRWHYRPCMRKRMHEDVRGVDR